MTPALRPPPKAARPLAVILAAFTLLALIYNAATPIFEAPDEAWHFRAAHELAQTGRPPPLQADLPMHEVTPPALAHAIFALVIAPFDRAAVGELLRLNPDWFDATVNAGYQGVRGQFIHTDAERFPFRSDVWAVRAARLASTALGAATVALVWAIARAIFEPSLTMAPALCAALVAFNPKFVHLSATVGNDVAVAFVATLACAWMLRCMARPGAWRWLALGAIIAAAAWVKTQGIALIVPALVSLALTRAGVLRKAAALAAGLAPAALLWVAADGAAFLHGAHAALARVPPHGLVKLAASAPLWFTSYWGNVGIELRFDGAVDAALGVVALAAVIGCAVAVARGLPLVARRGGLIVLVAWLLTTLAMFALWLRTYVGSENARLLIPNAAAVAVLVALGWLTLWPRRLHLAGGLALGGGLFALAAATPFFTIAPAYAPPPLRDAGAALAARGLALPATAPMFNGEIRLLHAQLDPPARARPGEAIRVAVVWGAERPIGQSYRVVLEAIDLSGEVIGRRRFIPHNGRFPTTRWPAGQFFRDEYELPIDANAPGGPARITLGVLSTQPESRLLPIDGGGDRFVIGRAKIASDPAPAPAGEPLARFGDMIALERAEVVADRVTFDWRAERVPDRDYTLFVHVLNAAGELIAQADGPPFGGEYPTTLWDAGERVRDSRALALPPGAATLRVGWYHAVAGERLPALRPSGQGWPDGAVEIALSAR